MRRDTVGTSSQDGGSPARREVGDSLQEPSRAPGRASGPLHQPSLTAVALGRPQTAAPHASAAGAAAGGAEVERPGSEWPGGKTGTAGGAGATLSDFSEAIREEPPPSPSAGGAGPRPASGGSGGKAALLPTLPHSPRRIKAVHAGARPATALPGGALSPGKEASGTPRRSSLAL